MFKKILFIIIVLMIIAGIFLIITFFIPDVYKFASELSARRELPLWFVGLFAPIAFLFQKIANWISGLFHISMSEEKAIKKENKQIKEELVLIKEKIKELDTWRNIQLEAEMKRFSQTISTLEEIDRQTDELTRGLKKLKEDNTRLKKNKTMKEELQRLDEQLNVCGCGPTFNTTGICENEGV